MHRRLYVWLIVGNILVIACVVAYLFLRDSPSSGYREILSNLKTSTATPEPIQKLELLTPDKILDEAEKRINGADFSAAASLADKALEQTLRDSQKVRALFLKAQSMAGRREYNEAIALSLQALDIDSNSANLYILISDCLRRTDYHQPAISFLELARERTGNSKIIELKLMLAQIQSGQREKVAEKLRQAIENDSLPSHLAYAHVVNLYLTGNLEQANLIMDNIKLNLPQEAVALMLNDPVTPSGWKKPL